MKYSGDVKTIKPTDEKNEAQCRRGNIRVLSDPSTGLRSILYFRHETGVRARFVEWPGKQRL